MSILGDLEVTSGHAPANADEARRQVAAACRIIARYGHEDLTLGHVAVRGPGPHELYIKAKGKALGDVTADDVMLVRLDDPEGHRAPGAHLETVMHTETYRARPDVGASIHTHALYATALGATQSSLEYLSHDAVLFNDGVGIYNESVGMVMNREDGAAVARALGDRRAVLLQNHGMLAVGGDIRWAVLSALTLERAVRVQVLASSLGAFTPIPDAKVDEIHRTKYQASFLDEYWTSWIHGLAGSAGDLE